MKKKILTVAVVTALCGSLCLTSCIGSFQLTNKLLSWNRNISNKFVNELVFIAFWILPVYEVSGLADILVLNSIEFWSGTNPVAQGKYKIEGKNGELYLVECDGKGYTVTNTVDDSTFRFDFNDETSEWSVDIDGQSYVFMTFIDDNHVKLPLADGSSIVVSTDEAGLYAYQAAVGASDLALR